MNNPNLPATKRPGQTQPQMNQAAPLVETREPNDFQPELAQMLATAGTIELTDVQTEILYSPVNRDEVEIRSDGLVYLPWSSYAIKLRQAFGLTAVFIPQGLPVKESNTIIWGFYLIIKGTIAAFAIGGQDFIPSNKQMTYPDAIEGAKSNAKMRCCKDVGIGLELWNKGFLKKWKAEYADSEMRKDKHGNNKRFWWKKHPPNTEASAQDNQPKGTQGSPQDSRQDNRQDAGTQAGASTDRTPPKNKPAAKMATMDEVIVLAQSMGLTEIDITGECLKLFKVGPDAVSAQQWAVLKTRLESMPSAANPNPEQPAAPISTKEEVMKLGRSLNKPDVDIVEDIMNLFKVGVAANVSPQQWAILKARYEKEEPQQLSTRTEVFQLAVALGFSDAKMEEDAKALFNVSRETDVTPQQWAILKAKYEKEKSQESSGNSTSPAKTELDDATRRILQTRMFGTIFGSEESPALYPLSAAHLKDDNNRHSFQLEITGEKSANEFIIEHFAMVTEALPALEKSLSGQEEEEEPPDMTKASAELTLQALISKGFKKEDLTWYAQIRELTLNPNSQKVFDLFKSFDRLSEDGLTQLDTAIEKAIKWKDDVGQADVVTFLAAFEDVISLAKNEDDAKQIKTFFFDALGIKKANGLYRTSDISKERFSTWRITLDNAAEAVGITIPEAKDDIPF